MGGGGGLNSNVFLFKVPQHDNTETGQAHQSQLTEMQRVTGRVGGGVLLQHKDNNVNTRITNRNAFFSESALTVPSPPNQRRRVTQM